MTRASRILYCECGNQASNTRHNLKDQVGLVQAHPKHFPSDTLFASCTSIVDVIFEPDFSSRIHNSKTCGNQDKPTPTCKLRSHGRLPPMTHIRKWGADLRTCATRHSCGCFLTCPPLNALTFSLIIFLAEARIRLACRVRSFARAFPNLGRAAGCRLRRNPNGKLVKSGACEYH